MNGIVLLSLSVALQGNVAMQSGIEFGWTQLPDSRVEYIIQLDEPALDALKNGQPLTSSIPPEIQSADRIRIQYGTGGLNKPILSRKPQSGYPPAGNPQSGGAPRFSMDSGGFQGVPRNGHTIADTPPALNVSELTRDNSFGTRGQVTVKNGNVNSVSNSSMGGTRQTAFLTQESGTNPAIHWSNSKRVIGNYDDQNRMAANQNRTANAGTNNGAAINSNMNNTNVGGGNVGAGNVGAGNAGSGSIGNSNFANRTGSRTGNTGGQANVPNNNFNNAGFGQTNQPNNGLGNSGVGNNGVGNNGVGNTGVGNGGMSPVRNRNLNNNGQNTGWTSVNNPNRTNNAQGMLNPNALVNGNSMINPNALNPNAFNANAMNPNALNQNAMINPNMMNTGIPSNGYRTAQNYLPHQSPNLVAQPGGTTVPVSTAAPSNDADVAMLKQNLETMKGQLQQRDHDAEIAKLKADQKAELEKLANDVKEFKKKREDSAAVTPVVQTKDDDSKRGSSSGIASVFLVISLGLNVFLVVQYLSVQNQFRDLSNDLRDTFMTNSYE